jgi:hypothetical protein
MSDGKPDQEPGPLPDYRLTAVGPGAWLGQDGTVALSQEAATYFQRHRCQVQLLPTPEVIPV